MLKLGLRAMGGLLGARKAAGAAMKVAKPKAGMGLKKASLNLGGARSSANASSFMDRAYSKQGRRIAGKIQGF
jgi:hypothetical protein